MGTERKPAPPGYVRDHPLDPNLVRKLPERTAASDFYPGLKSNEEWRKQQEDAEAKERIRRDKWR
jgi:hypothetical protein